MCQLTALACTGGNNSLTLILHHDTPVSLPFDRSRLAHAGVSTGSLHTRLQSSELQKRGLTAISGSLPRRVWNPPQPAFWQCCCRYLGHRVEMGLRSFTTSVSHPIACSSTRSLFCVYGRITDRKHMRVLRSQRSVGAINRMHVGIRGWHGLIFPVHAPLISPEQELAGRRARFSAWPTPGADNTWKYPANWPTDIES